MSWRELFTVTEPEKVEAMLAGLRFGALVTHGPQGLTSTAMPWIYDPAARVLRGHMSRANPQRERHDGSDVMALFFGPNAYVTPNWYPSKKLHGKVAPTWNYETVQVHGPMRWIDDPDWILANVTELTDRFEAERDQDWKVTDAPADYVERLVRGVVGVEITVARVDAKQKFSQNREEDRTAVIEGLLATGDPADRMLAERMRGD